MTQLIPLNISSVVYQPQTKILSQRQASLRAHHQAIVWNHDTVAQPVIPPYKNTEWKQKGDG